MGALAKNIYLKLAPNVSGIYAVGIVECFKLAQMLVAHCVNTLLCVSFFIHFLCGGKSLNNFLDVRY